MEGSGSSLTLTSDSKIVITSGRLSLVDIVEFQFQVKGVQSVLIDFYDSRDSTTPTVEKEVCVFNLMEFVHKTMKRLNNSGRSI